MKSVNWPTVVSVGGVVVSIAALAFTYFRWRKERRPKLLVRLVREIHHSALPGQEGIYTKTAKILIDVYNDGNAAAEDVKVETEKDYQPPQRGPSADHRYYGWIPPTWRVAARPVGAGLPVEGSESRAPSFHDEGTVQGSLLSVEVHAQAIVRATRAMTSWFLIKFLTRPGYAEDFLRGQVRASPLTTFKEPIRDPAGRADPHEGTSGLFQPGRKGLVINGREFGLELAEPARVQLNRLNHLHVVCLHAARTEPVHHFTDTPAGIEEFRRQIKVPERCLELGPEAIVIRDVHEFCARMAAAAKTRGYTLVGRGPVRYYDPLDFHGWIPGK